MSMNDKEVKDWMLQAYRMGDFELRFLLIMLNLLIVMVPISLVLILALAIFCPKQESKPAPSKHPIEMSVEK